MNERMARAIALMLLLTLCVAVPPVSVPGAARAEEQAVVEASSAEPPQREAGRMPETVPPDAPPIAPESAPPAAPETTPESAPSTALEPTPPAVPGPAPGEPTAAAPADEGLNAAPSDSPAAESAEAPAEPAASPSPAPTEPPAEPPAAPAYGVSPAEAAYALGSPEPLRFIIEPADAPFAGIDGLPCDWADGAVTIAPEALSALGEGLHILRFLFADGAVAEAALTVAPRMAARGQMDSLIIGGSRIDGARLTSDISSAAQRWSWSAASATLTLDGYDGGRIAFAGSRALTVALAPGSVNAVAAGAEDVALYAESPLTLTGGGTLNASGARVSAIASQSLVSVEGGTIRASGGERAICSEHGGIRLSGGAVTVRLQGHQGTGFSANSATQVSGAAVTVEGAAAAFGALDVASGSVTIRDCDVGASRGLNASGGVVTIEGVAVSGAEADSGMSFSNCRLTLTGCGQYGLRAGGAIRIGSGATVQIEAGQVALYAPGRGGSIAILKGASLDLHGGERAIQGTRVLIGGRKYAGAYNHVIVQNGAVSKQENAVVRLTAGGETYRAASLASDQGGAGWAWTAATATLTLDGYGGGPVTASGGAIRLALSGSSAIEGDLTVAGASVSGDGSLTAARIVSAAGLEIRSGAVGAARLMAQGGLTLSGGEVSLSGSGDGPAVACTDFTMTGGALNLVGEGGLTPEGVRPSGKAAIRGGTVIVNGFNDFLSAAGGVAVSGGSVRVEGGTGAGIAAGGDIAVSGGSLWMATARCPMVSSRSILISGKPSLRLESASETALRARAVRIAGRAYAARYPGVVVENGRLADEYKLLPDLILADRGYSMRELNMLDFSGEGWAWSARRNTLTLSGYRGKGIWINRAVTVSLAPGTSNSGSDDFQSGGAALCALENLTLTGTGRWSGGVYCAGKLSVTGSPSLSAGAIRAGAGGIAVSGGRIHVSGDLRAEGGVSIRNSRVEAGRVAGARVSIANSSVFTSIEGDEGDPDLRGDGGLSISGSLVFCTQFGAPHGRVSLSGSPVFRRSREDGGEVWVLHGSASVARDMVVPPGRDCLVPASGRLSISKGRRLYVYGSLTALGRLTGAVVRRSQVGRIEVSGSALVAKGRSVPLTAKVVPALDGGQADQAVSWVSARPDLITVSDRGVVTAAPLSKVGDSAEITCSALDGSGVAQTLTVTVSEPAKKITLLYGGAAVVRLSAARGAPLELDCLVDPPGASDRVRWTSSSAAAAVDPETGAVLPRKKGTVTIACAATDGTGVRASVRLTIK